MPIVRNETDTVMLITGGAEDGGSLRLAPRGAKGDRVELAKINDAISRAEKNNLVKTFAGKKSGGKQKPEPPKPQPKTKDASEKPEQPKAGEK